MAKKNITKNDEKKASRAVVDTKSLDGSTRSGGIDRSGAALPTDLSYLCQPLHGAKGTRRTC